ncbi:MAG: hypothetical protein PHW22_02830 [Bacilli bacterium]|nr:hypothetical protein [Bacilli bacterium]
MKNYVEWADRKMMIDLRNKYCTLYKNEDGSMFYIEPVFYQGLETFKSLRGKDFQKILDEMDRIVHKNGLVVFTGDSKNPITFVDDNVKVIYLEITDITDKLNIFLQDTNFQGDYVD